MRRKRDAKVWNANRGEKQVERKKKIQREGKKKKDRIKRNEWKKE